MNLLEVYRVLSELKERIIILSRRVEELTRLIEEK